MTQVAYRRVVDTRVKADLRVDITTGDDDQTLRILSALDPEQRVTGLDVLRPRLDRASQWVAEQVPAEDRTIVREQPDPVAHRVPR